MVTPKQEKFCQAVVRGSNQSEACRLAYGVKKATPKTINERASRLMANSKVVARVAELRAPAVKAVQHDQARWLQELQRCAFVDPRQFFDADGNPIAIPALTDESAPAVAGFEVTQEFAGKGDARELVGYTKKMKLTDKLKALELFGKATGFYVDHSVPAPSLLESASTELLLTMCEAIRERMQPKELSHADSP